MGRDCLEKEEFYFLLVVRWGNRDGKVTWWEVPGVGGGFNICKGALSDGGEAWVWHVCFD